MTHLEAINELDPLHYMSAARDHAGTKDKCAAQNCRRIPEELTGGAPLQLTASSMQKPVRPCKYMVPNGYHKMIVFRNLSCSNQRQNISVVLLTAPRTKQAKPYV